MAPKPTSIIAQVAGSGTAAGIADVAVIVAPGTLPNPKLLSVEFVVKAKPKKVFPPDVAESPIRLSPLEKRTGVGVENDENCESAPNVTVPLSAKLVVGDPKNELTIPVPPVEIASGPKGSPVPVNVKVL